MKLLITGGAGFIGSNFVRQALANHSDWQVIVLDKLTYAGRMENLRDCECSNRYSFVRGDIADPVVVDPLVAEVDAIVSFAAETHVDRSLLEPGSFIKTDVYGTYVLLEAARKVGGKRFLLVSTDEVYGSVEIGAWSEADPLDPRSPYSASKAGGELLARAYYTSFDLPVLITRGSNTFGPYHYPEKLIPLFITNALEDLPLPLYGDGLNVRDWLYVADHCAAIDLVLRRGEPGQVYNVGGGNERTNREVTELILRLLGKPQTLIRYVSDRPGHDRRYALDTSRIQSLGWTPEHSFEEALASTVRWYVDNQWWWRPIRSGEYVEYYRQNYAHRLQ